MIRRRKLLFQLFVSVKLRSAKVLKKMSKMLPVLLAMFMLVVSLAPAHAQDKTTLKIWYYEAADSATGQSWAEAMTDFQAAHPDVTLDFELKTFDQIQQTGQMILNSDD